MRLHTFGRDLLALTIGFLVMTAVLSGGAVLHAMMQPPSFTQAQIAQMCIKWDQAVGANANNNVATVQAYKYLLSIDGGTAVQSGVTCADTPGHTGPFPCQIAAVPDAGRTVGSHTLSLTATDPTGQVSPAASYVYAVTAPIGPPAMPGNLRIEAPAGAGGTLAIGGQVDPTAKPIGKPKAPRDLRIAPKS